MLFTEYFDIGYLGYAWLLIALAFLFAELGTPGLFFFVSFAVGALFAAALAFIGYSLVVQCVAGLAVAIGSFFLIRRHLVKKKFSQVLYGFSETNIDALVGSVGVVTSSILPHHRGRVKVGREEWPALGQDGVAFEKGTVIKVLKISGNTVVVKSYKSKDS